MKKVFRAMLVLGLLIFGILSSVTASEAASSKTEAIFVFKANGGKGTMKESRFEVGKSAKLPANTFKRTGYHFVGWNTKYTGEGTAYSNKMSVTKSIAKYKKTTKVTLYAQWKPVKPVISGVSAYRGIKVKLTYPASDYITGYNVQCADNKYFKNAVACKAKKGTKSVAITAKATGKTNYLRMRSYYKNGTKYVYSDWSEIKTIKMPKAYTIYNTSAETAIEADVTLKGSGSGYHAKLVLVTPTSAVSFGIQYDKHAVAPYTGKAMALIENVDNNGNGGQKYSRPGNKELKVGQTYHMMITIDKSGNGAVYLDYQKIGSFTNKKLAASVANTVYVRCEGSARLNGDQVDAAFTNIHITRYGKDLPASQYRTAEFKVCPTIKNTVSANGDVHIKGKVSGIRGDWDSDYSKVSGIIQYVF